MTDGRAAAGGAPRLRVLLLTAVLQAAFLWWVADSEILRSVYLICYALMMPTALLLAFSGLLRRLLGLTRAELLFVYVVLTVTLPIAGFGAVRFLVPGMGYLPYAAESDPSLAAYLPSWRDLPTISDPAGVRAIYQGGPFLPRPWRAPLLFWSGYLLLFAAAWLGAAALFRRAWISHERLSFPIAQIPLELTDPQTAAWRRPGFWVGALIPVVLQSLLALHEWFPGIPAFTLRAQNVREMLFPNPPWNAIPDIQVGFYPMAVGLGYFMPGPVAFSCLFFWLATRLAYVAGFALGVAPSGIASAGRFPYVQEQGAGAWIGMAVMTFFALRRASSDTGASDMDRVWERRLGAGAGGALLLAVVALAANGIPPAMAVTTALVYACYVVTAARVRAESGAIWTFAPLGWTAGRTAVEMLRTAPLAPSAVAAGGLFDLVHVDIRGQSLPYVMEGLKIADAVGLRWRTVLLWCAAFTLPALALSWWFQIAATHEAGAATAKVNFFALAKVRISFAEAFALAGRPPWPDLPGIAAAGFGGLFTALLSVLRSRFVAFPLHPIGYVLGLTLTMNAFVVPVLFAFVARALVLRYGGGAAYRKSVAFFVGLTLGDIFVQTFWALVGRILDVPVYGFLT